MYGQSYRLKEDITVADLITRTRHVVSREVDVIRNQLARNQVSLFAAVPAGSRTRTPSPSSN